MTEIHTENFPPENLEALDAISNDHPVDINTFASALEVDDGYNQDEILRDLFQGGIVPEKERDLFESLKVHTILLSQIKETFMRRQTSKAINQLNARCKIKIDREMQIPNNDQNIYWGLREHRLDYLLTVSAEIGLWAATPNVNTDHNYILSMELNKPYRDFKGKYGKLGFDPKGRILHIGKSKNNDVWLAMAPLSFFDESEETAPAGHVTGDTRLSTKHYRMIVIFFAYLLSKLNDRGFTCLDMYGISLTDIDPYFSIYTNILDQDVHTNLRLRDVQFLNENMERLWSEWVENAPMDWKNDGFLREHAPIAITSRYGQDQPICSSVERRNESQSWFEERCYHKIRFVSVGLATHVSATEVEEWIDINTEEIIERHPIIYDSWDPSCRERINDLQALPLHDEQNNEKRIYDPSGRKIARRDASISEDTIPCGLLVNLRTVTSLFQSDDDMEIDDDLFSEAEEATQRLKQNKVSLSVYPQAFLRDYGHIQAKGSLDLLQPTIKRINSSFQQLFDDLDDDSQPRNTSLITAISTQMYNEFMHRAATQAGALDVVRGRMSSALAVPPNERASRGNRQMGEVLKRYCRVSLPHARFAERMQVQDCPTALRVESVYIVDMNGIPEPQRNGRTLYEQIICHLVDAWARTEVSDKLREHILLFKPGVYPSIYSWVTYGINVLQKQIYELEIETLEKGKRISPYRLEFLAALERTEAYAHTGNAKVLSNIVMKPLFITRALLEYGLPTINKENYTPAFQDITPLTIFEELWPLNKTKTGPAICSKRTQMLTYGETNYIMYETDFKIRHIRYICKDKFKNRITDNTLREAVCVADIAFNMFFNDIKAIIKAGVEADLAITSEDESPGIQIQIRERRKKLKQWLSMSSGFLDYDDDNYANLLRIIVTDPQLIIHGLPGATANEISTTEFATLLYEMVTNPHAHPVAAPVLSKGSFWPALQVAIKHIAALAPVDPPRFVINVLRLTAELLKIRFIPWKKHHDGPGRPSRIPVWNSWASLGAPNPKRDITSIALRPEEAIHKAALDAQQMAMSRDANVSWSLDDLKLRDLGDIFKHESLPSDWSIPTQSSDYVLQTYEYVRDVYDSNNEVHKLALLVSIILGCCLPNIHAPPETSTLLSNQTTRAGTRNTVQSLPWISKSKTKGSKDSRIHVTMFATFIIALYDSKSPLRKHMVKNNESLGDLWTNKHRPKGVIPLTLLRVGVIWGIGSRAYTSGRFGNHWGLLTPKDISGLLNDLQDKLKSQPNGVGDVLVTLLGRDKAEEVATK